ncbi:von Hippel-Lindau disease tumor suppressor-like [Dreissena polymorpha]|uniref:von Hippel-Lindau disease tumour suppressor beta domain-containing protein n=1 Tax=Dreissena polymorpha TaxID=45954 RepID=A0A9D4N2F8_DREPO|nr:von Hippel-Lindau disease tumor suppressor-like [Dreissena polymorpha]XP_052228642.1 von Hippel-Lindau disease tumor suppressor-like [Dreissena polymorpha]XP_052228652.1 von Hippel-Lindau disease tumor suppressor-like [Dreissena polymorpha]XP_052228662.1 von Hippel-Lindau disease tumor suppressor-like [Dreissena polymorpha]XP_052228671.1 von Hippel-Lindau disease tumor suppressor-like [Dreissena polymorpha]XP_052228677.1 von Hippel-Lindau disease tumor suppressor-like [Dreissena polymorpha]
MAASEDTVDKGDGRAVKKLASTKSLRHSFVRFCNASKVIVDVFWINYEGKSVLYKRLLPYKWMDVNTFEGHPWIFLNAQTGDKMVVANNDVYFPASSAQSEDDERLKVRTLVTITLPLYSLQECCVRAVRHLVAEDKVRHLEITDMLKTEILHSVQNLNKKSTITSTAQWEELLH